MISLKCHAIPYDFFPPAVQELNDCLDPEVVDRYALTEEAKADIVLAGELIFCGVLDTSIMYIYNMTKIVMTIWLD